MHCSAPSTANWPWHLGFTPVWPPGPSLRGEAVRHAIHKRIAELHSFSFDSRAQLVPARACKEVVSKPATALQEPIIVVSAVLITRLHSDTACAGKAVACVMEGFYSFFREHKATWSCSPWNSNSHHSHWRFEMWALQ